MSERGKGGTIVDSKIQDKVLDDLHDGVMRLINYRFRVCRV